MRIHIGPAGIPLSSEKGDTASGIAKVAELGLDAMEVEFVRGVHMGVDAAMQVGKAAQKTGIMLSVHAPYFINLCNPEKAKASEKRILDSCERAHHMGAWIVVFHPGYYGKLEKKDALRLVEESCMEMSSVISKKGWEVMLGLETTGKFSQFGTLDEIIEICSRNRGCVPVIDWAHLYAYHQGKPDYRAIIRKVTDAGYARIHTHFSNINFSDKGERNHLALSHRKPDFRDVAKVILASGLVEVTLISESPELENDALVMKKDFQGLGHRF